MSTQSVPNAGSMLMLSQMIEYTCASELRKKGNIEFVVSVFLLFKIKNFHVVSPQRTDGSSREERSSPNM